MPEMAGGASGERRVLSAKARLMSVGSIRAENTRVGPGNQLHQPLRWRGPWRGFMCANRLLSGVASSRASRRPAACAAAAREGRLRTHPAFRLSPERARLFRQVRAAPIAPEHCPTACRRHRSLQEPPLIVPLLGCGNEALPTADHRFRACQCEQQQHCPLSPLQRWRPQRQTPTPQ